MSDNDALQLISITAQRWIPTIEVDNFVDYLRDLGVTNAQIKEYCNDHIVSRTNL